MAVPPPPGNTSRGKSWDPVENQQVPVKNNESKIENAWAFMKPYSSSEDRLQNPVLQYTEIKI